MIYLPQNIIFEKSTDPEKLAAKEPTDQDPHYFP